MLDDLLDEVMKAIQGQDQDIRMQDGDGDGEMQQPGMGHLCGMGCEAYAHATYANVADFDGA
jgi:hypothetical protein